EPDGSPVVVSIKVTLAVPPETPRDANLTLTHPSGTLAMQFESGAFTAAFEVGSTEAFTVSLAMVAPLAATPLDAAGASMATLTIDPARAGLSGPTMDVPLTVARWAPVAPTANGLVALVVAVPATTPAADAIHVSGDLPALGAWDGIGQTLYRGVDGRFATMLQLPNPTTFEYKFTRGSWDTVEKALDGSERENRSASLTAAFARIEVSVAAWRDLIPTKPTAGHVDLVDAFPSAFLVPDRDLVIYLPPGYSDAANAAVRYPVLYMHDGQNLMDPATSAFGTEWQVDETAEMMISAGDVAPVIIVGVGNTVDRIPEYTPVVDAEYGGGDADDYGRFLTEELMPYIDSHYRTDTAGARTGLAGSSLGGLVSLYLGLEYPNDFGRLGVISPSVWWADQYIVGYVEALATKPPLHIWLDIGTTEGQETVSDTRLLRDALTAKGWVLNQDLAYHEYQGASHNEAAWAARFDEILKDLYPAP
ncbi:MAG: carbohydrate esterase, partial [Deltaproteobacteria bacterium]|nr:carbohydrate esterase [Deltaproteobacteria bacterium]